MRLRSIPAIVFSTLFLAIPASAIVTLGASTQTFALTGIGANSSGQGQSTMKWGNCVFDGTNTNCTLSGSFTGLGPGGTYSFVLTYPGNGAFPLLAVSQTPGSDFFYAQALSNYSLVITLAETNGPSIHFYSFANFQFLYNGAATCTGSVSSCGIGQVGLNKGATISGPIIGSFDPAPAISVPNGVISASNYGGFTAIAPATWIEIYGINLATTLSQTWAGSDFNGNTAPTSLGASGGAAGTSVTIGGLPAYVYYISPGQLNVQVPSGVPAGPASVVVTTAGGASAIYSITVNTVEPGMLSPAAFSIKGSQYVVAQLSNTVIYVLPVAVSGIQTARTKPGDSITLYGIGFGTVTPAIAAGQIVQGQNALQGALKVSIGGVSANITYAGLAPGFVGLYQINVTVPQIAASDTAPITFTLNGTSLPQQNLVIPVGS